MTLVDSAYRQALWNAAYLIEGGCGDNGFMDFRDGLLLLGGAVFERAVADPDWHPEDDDENRRHLPRLTALFPQ